MNFGLEMTTSIALQPLTLRVDLEDFDGYVSFAEYSIFKVAGGSDKYRLLIGAYNGTAGDSMAYQK